MSMEKRNFVYDIECLFNFFCVTFVDRYSDEKFHFRIGGRYNDLVSTDKLSLVSFLDTMVSGLIGFNNLAYDWPLLNHVYVIRGKLSRMRGDDAARAIYEFSQKIIGQKYSNVRSPRIPQLDLFKIHHFDNKNKAVSLKALQIAMGWPLVADMPVSHLDFSQGEGWMDGVEEYNTNDVLSTKFFLEKSNLEIELRKSLSDIYDIDLLNLNDAKIGETIILNRISKDTGVPEEILKLKNTKRDFVNIGECLLQYSFNSAEFKKCHEVFLKTVLDTRIREEDEQGKKEKEEEQDLYSCIYDNVRYDFGFGGLHGIRGPGVYREDEDNVILSADVSSYYPNLGIRNGFRPEHLGDSFPRAMQSMYEERKNYKKNSPPNYGLKIAMNGATGKSKSQWSFIYDPKFTMQINCNGQLLLVDFCEMVTEAGGKVIMANTDGAEVLMSRQAFQDGVFDRVCKSWEAKTGLTLEFKQYKHLFIRDVNNYVGEFVDGKTYNKGAYEWRDYDEDGIKLLKWEKDHSMLCVPYAAEKYLLSGQSIKKSFEECDMSKFMIGKRAKSEGKFEIRATKLVNNNPEVVTTYYHKTIRYMIVKRDGGWLFKNEPGRKKPTKIDSPWRVLDCMDLRNKNLEDLRSFVDYRYYEIEVQKILNPILRTQTSLT